MKIGVIIPAGGSGRRMGSARPKQYLKIKGVPIIDRTLSVFQGHPGVHEIVLVLPPADVRKKGADFLRRFSKIKSVVPGGKERTHSVRNGFAILSKKCNIVLVHDAVRPFVRPQDVTNVVRGAKKHGAVTLAVPVKDTIKVVKRDRILNTPDRATLWHTLTPQGFQRDVLDKLLKYAESKKITGTDECMIAEKMGFATRVVLGHFFNLKLTTPEDLTFAEGILSSGREKTTKA